MLLLGASGVFAQLQESLNIIWRVKANTTVEGLWKTLKDRFISLLAVLGTGFLLLISLVISAGLSGVGALKIAFEAVWNRGATFEELLPGSELLLQLINFVVSFAVVTLLFAMIYKLPPDTPIRWDDGRVGAGITSLLFTIGKFFIGLYNGKSDVGVPYGAAGVSRGNFDLGLPCVTDISVWRGVHGCICRVSWCSASSGATRSRTPEHMMPRTRQSSTGQTART